MEKEINKNQFYKNPAFSGIFYFKTYALFVLLVVCGGYSYSQAIIKVDDPKQSFNTVIKGEVVELNYILYNIGNEPLLLYKYEVQCSCTSVLYDDKPILPGKSSTVTVKFDTKTVYDRQDRIVILSSNNKNGDIKLRFKGFVKRK